MKVFIAGHHGMVGSAILRRFEAESDVEIITRTRAELDLTDPLKVAVFLNAEKPDSVIIAAAKVGGIHANSVYPADFIYQNLMIQNNLIHQSHLAGINRILFLGSSCIYPKFSDQPIKEEYLLTGKLEPTNEPYAIAKIAGIKMCESYNRQYGRDYRSVMPTNLYGPGDNFHHENSHVVPALIRRFHYAKINNLQSVVVWGSGNPRREFLYVDDMAEASLHVLGLSEKEYAGQTEPMQSHINVGSGRDLSIKELAESISKVVSYTGEIVFDSTKPDGTPQKLMDSNKLSNLGWKPKVSLAEGLQRTYSFFKEIS